MALLSGWFSGMKLIDPGISLADDPEPWLPLFLRVRCELDISAVNVTSAVQA